VRLLLLGLLFLAAREPDVAAPKGLFKRLSAPQPGEWLWVFPEEGQTFAEYKASGPVRPTAERRTIYLVPHLTRPLPDPELLARIRAVLEGYFGLEVRTLPRAPLPTGAYVRTRRQVSVQALVPHLVRTLPEDGAFLLAVTDRDLFIGDLPYAYGWGSLDLRVGVLSTARLGAEDDPLRWRRRALTLALHEAGHLISLPHCTFFHCLMNGALTREEADRRPAILCPVCQAKLCWSLGLPPRARDRAVAEALRETGLLEDAREAQRVADANPVPTDN